MLGLDEVLGNRVVKQRDHRIEVAANVQHADRFVMQPQRRPAQRFEELLEGPDAPGQRQKRRGSAGHHGLPLVHVAHDVQLGQSMMGDLLDRQRLWNHPDRLASSLEDRVGHDSHQPHPAAAVYQAETVTGDRPAHLCRRLGKPRINTQADPQYTQRFFSMSMMTMVSVRGTDRGAGTGLAANAIASEEAIALAPVMYHTVARVGEIAEGRGIPVEIEGRVIAVFRDEGNYYAIDDACPHKGAPLCDGIVFDKTVTCTWHGWHSAWRPADRSIARPAAPEPVPIPCESTATSFRSPWNNRRRMK